MAQTKVSLRILDSSLNLLAELSIAQDFYFTRSLTQVGPFSIVINSNIDGAQYLVQDNYVLFGTDLRRFGIIEQVAMTEGPDGKGSQITTVTGKEAKNLFARRICLPPTGSDYYHQSASVESTIKALVKDQCGSTAATNRKLALLTIATDSARGGTYVLNARNTSLIDELQMACESQSPFYGYQMSLDTTNKKLIFDIIVGLNRTAGQSTNARAIFSSDYDTLQASTYTKTNINYKNFAYAGGQGEGSDRTIVPLYSGESEPTDTARREYFIDARDLQLVDDITNRAAADLQSKVLAQQTIDASILVLSTLTIGTDFDLGDLCTVRTAGTSFDLQVTQVKESWKNLDYNIECTFGHPLQTIAAAVHDATGASTASFTVTEPTQYQDRYKTYTYSTSITTNAQVLSDVPYNTIILTGSVNADILLTLYFSATDSLGSKKYSILNQITSSVDGTRIKIISSAGLAYVYIKNGTNADVIVDTTGNVYQIGGAETVPQDLRGMKAGLEISYVSSDTLSIAPGQYHINDGVTERIVQIGSAIAINSGTTNFPATANGRFICLDNTGAMTLENATVSGTIRASDAVYQSLSSGKYGYYFSATKRIIGVIYKVSSTIWQITNNFDRDAEAGFSTVGTWERFVDGVMKQTGKTFVAIPVANIVNNNIGTFGWTYYYGVTTGNYPTPFLTVPKSHVATGNNYVNMVSIDNLTASQYDITLYSSAAALATQSAATWEATGVFK